MISCGMSACRSAVPPSPCLAPSAVRKHARGRYLGDPSGQAQFVAEKLDLAAVPADTATTAAAGGAAGGSSGSSDKAASSSRPSTGGSVVGRFGFYDAWALLDLLLAEWLGRAWGRARTMARLRR